MSGQVRRHAASASVALLAVVPVTTLLLSRGFVLHHDSVAVPDQALLPWMWGAGSAPPRSVPQDALVAVLDDVVPGWILQRLMIVGALLLLGFGLMHLMRERTQVEQVCAAVLAVWSTYVFERMAMGHWGLLLGVAALPWVLVATADARDVVPGAPARALAWTALGSLVPTAGALQLAAIVLVLSWPGRRARRPTAVVLLGGLLLQLVWIVPAIGNAGLSTVEAAGVFGLRSEGSGLLLTALTTGGIWNSEAMPASRAGYLSVIAAGVLLTAAAAGVSGIRSMRSTIIGPLAVLAGLGLGWAILSALPTASDTVAAVESVPGGGLLRDAQKWLAPWLILLAVAAGIGLARLAGALADRGARGPGIVLVVLLPVLLLPDLAFGMWGRVAPVEYPNDWERVRDYLAQAQEPGDVVSWPWSTFRAYAWNDHRTSLDPAPRYLPRTVVTDSRLLVHDGDELIVVPSDDEQARAVGDSLMTPDAALRLASLGVGWILVQRDQPTSPSFPTALPPSLTEGSQLVLAGPTLELRRLTAAVPSPWHREGRTLLLAWIAWGLVVFTSMGLLVSRSFRRSIRRL